MKKCSNFVKYVFPSNEISVRKFHPRKTILPSLSPEQNLSLPAFFSTDFSRALNSTNKAITHPLSNALFRSPYSFPTKPFPKEDKYQILSMNSQLRYYKGASKTPPKWSSSTEKPRKNDESENMQNMKSEVIYHGPFSSTLKSVKLLSLTTCCLSVTLGPVITFFTLPGMNVVPKGIVASIMVILSASTTFFLHWFTSPYVHKLVWKTNSDTVEVQTLSWLATSNTKSFKLSDVKPVDTNRPLANFSANGVIYYVDQDNFSDQSLLKKLVK